MAGRYHNSSSGHILGTTAHSECSVSWEESSPPCRPFDLFRYSKQVLQCFTWHNPLSRTGLIPGRAARLTGLWTGSCQHDASTGLWQRLLWCWLAGSAAVKHVVRCCPENVALALKRELVRLPFAMVSVCPWHGFWIITRYVSFSSYVQAFRGCCALELWSTLHAGGELSAGAPGRGPPYGQ